MRSKVHEKFGRMELSDVEEDLKSYTADSKATTLWTCAPKWVDDVIEEDGLFWVNYACDTLGFHSYGPYRTPEEAEKMKQHLIDVSQRFGPRF